MERTEENEGREGERRRKKGRVTCVGKNPVSAVVFPSCSVSSASSHYDRGG
jgi:hypothetical protein